MAGGEQRRNMTESQFDKERRAVDRAIALTEAALHECDEHGFLYAAIDLSVALDKLKQIRSLQP
jgi:hypothetical protein